MDSENRIKENKMGTMHLPSLLFSISIPIVISMLVQALYNIVDSIYVAQFNNIEGTGALTIAFPVQNLMIALAVGLAVGTNALLSRSLGQKNFDKANLIAGQGFFLNFCGYLVFLVLGVFATKAYVATQAGAEGLLFEYSVDYISIICICSVGVFIQVVCERLLQATGKSMLSMLVQGSGAIINIILDPIMIFGWLGCPQMGVAGAAIATVIGQCVAAAIGIFLNVKFNKDIRLSLKNFIPQKDVLIEMLAIGIPSVLMQAVGSIMTFCMNIILISFSNEALNVFGVYFKLQSFVFMPVFGLNNGIIPIISYNYGAGYKDRVRHTVRLGIITATSYMLFGLLVFQIFPEVLLGFFNASENMLKIGDVALRIISPSFLLAGVAVISSAVCQALGKSVYSLVVSVARQLVVLIPAAFLLSLAGNLTLVWLAFPIAELVSFVLSIFFLIRSIEKAFGKRHHHLPA